jgi:hypothetical protein
MYRNVDIAIVLMYSFLCQHIEDGFHPVRGIAISVLAIITPRVEQTKGFVPLPFRQCPNGVIQLQQLVGSVIQPRQLVFIIHPLYRLSSEWFFICTRWDGHIFIKCQTTFVEVLL